MNIENAINSQIESFYLKRKHITHRNQVDCVITDDVFSKYIELAQTEKDRALAVQQKDFLQQVNGSVIFGKTTNNKIIVLLSSKVFQLDSYTWRGTVHHEYTHAHDFWALADYLHIAEMDDLYDYEYYTPFMWWSEYHARMAGSLNVFQYNYARYSASAKINVCMTSFEMICRSLTQVSSAYDAMQHFGRYSTLKNMYGNMMPQLQTANKKYGLSNRIIDVGEFLLSHSEFPLICDHFDEFQALINAV